MATASNPFAPKPRAGVSDVMERLRSDLRQRLGLAEDATVSIAEISCHEPGCPDVETVIAIMQPNAPNRLLRIHKRLADVRQEDVAAVLAQSPCLE